MRKRKVDPVVECIAAKLWLIENYPASWGGLNSSDLDAATARLAAATAADYRRSARRIKRALAKDGYLREKPHGR